jgi:hypothetical protein
MWAKYKPVKRFELFVDLHVSNNWGAVSGNSGILAPTGGTINGIINMVREGNAGWDYDVPTGGTLYPFRLGDFRGYRHDAQAPFSFDDVQSPIVYNSQYDTFSVSISLRQNAADELGISDFAADMDFGNMYFGVIISRQNQQTAQYITEAVKLGAGSPRLIEIPMVDLMNPKAGTYDVIGVMAVNPHTSLLGEAIENSFIPLPDCHRILTVVEAAQQVSILALWAFGQFSFTVTIPNVSAASLSISSLRLQFRYNGNAINDPLEDGETSVLIGAVSIAAGETYTCTGTAEGGDYYEGRGGMYVIMYAIGNSALNGLTFSVGHGI